MSLASKIKDRAEMLRRAREFFHARSIIEVDCPLLSASASVDPHIDLVPALYAGKEWRHLHSSPEYGMKRLLSQESGDIYQLSHVFRDGEWGHKHNPEFMMAEWYRVGFSFEQMINETVDFVRLFIGDLPYSVVTYKEAFQRYAGINYLHASDEELRGCLSANFSSDADREELLNQILALIVEPELGKEEITALIYYPASQAALAQTKNIDNEWVAKRFELYANGYELANGYHELANAKEQRQRLLEANQQRLALGKKELPIDEYFLDALDKGLPDCCGVAVGFDRLMMVRHRAHSIADILPFPWAVA